MKKIAIIGGGIIGMTLANYLDTDKFDISLFDDEKNQATKASAGIISPWLSKRRNKKWYQLAKDGAAFFEKMKNDFELTEDVYEKCGTLFLRQKSDLNCCFISIIKTKRKFVSFRRCKIRWKSLLIVIKKASSKKRGQILFRAGNNCSSVR